MVGIVIGLLATLAVTQVMVASEGQKRATSAGSDAQTNGALALNTLQRTLQAAGYGFAAAPNLLGCTVSAVFNGAAYTSFMPQLAPVIITDGASGAPDTIRVFGSGKTSFSVPLRVVTPGYNPGISAQSQAFPVAAVRSVQGPQNDSGGNPFLAGDLMVASVSATPTTSCEVFQATDDPGASVSVVREDDAAHWNKVGFPTQTYPADAVIVNLGQPVDVTFSINANNALAVRTLRIAANGTPTFDGPVELFPNVVQLQAFYGKDTTVPADGTVDAWDNTTPTTAAGWQQVTAIRIAVVAQSSQYERDEVTASNPLWNVGSAIAIAGTVTCGSSKCLAMKVDTLTDWKHYRYRVFETIVPLRNMLWNN